ncbi:sedoheptulose-7-phosphate:D-glyceraldehyde-3- phosphate transaldolase, partial [Ascosphaera pollenicola]
MSSSKNGRPVASGYARLAQADEEEALHPHRPRHSLDDAVGGGPDAAAYRDDSFDFDEDDPFATPPTLSIAPNGASTSAAT